MKSKLLLTAILAGMIIFAGCSKKDENNTAKSDEVIPVEVVKVKKEKISRSIDLVGTLAAWKEANLGAQTTARVEKIFVEEGKFVKAGDLLFQMDDTQLKQTKIAYELAKNDYERIKPLFEMGSVSQSDFDRIKAGYENSEKTYNLMLTNTQFRAPFDGIITAKRMNEGEIFMLVPGAFGAPAVVQLMQLGTLKLITYVSEANFRDVKLNQPVEITSDIYPGEVFRGSVSKINPTINSTSRTFEIEVRIPNPSMRLRPGMFVRAKIFAGETEGIVISRASALKQLGTTAYYGFIIKNGTAVRVELNVGKEFDSRVEITSGLSEGDDLVSKGQGLLKDGSKVQIKSNLE
ncbi:MAG: efflux RND transporter periplasmic adaptor subunit [Ignavibacteriaceae bacterium]|nr:efflux RND transporter periplasmic adaptor subunit [Ignavibacteriaceae bacterium]